jgi:hypothetical protein
MLLNFIVASCITWARTAGDDEVVGLTLPQYSFKFAPKISNKPFHVEIAPVGTGKMPVPQEF